MQFLKYLSIRKKLVVNVVVPIVTIVIMASLVIGEHISKMDDYNLYSSVVKLDVKISAVVHETQKERGATAGFLASKGTKFVKRLPAQRLNTDTKFKELLTYIKTSNIKASLNQDSLHQLDKYLFQLDKIQIIRRGVTSQSIGIKKAISYYTGMHKIALDCIAKTSKLSPNAKLAISTLAYFNFLNSKERAGIERAVASGVFAKDKFSKGSKAKLASLISEQKSYMSNFEIIASKNNIEFLTNTLKGEAVDEVDRMRKVLFGNTEGGNFGIKATYWFDMLTKKINLLKQIGDHISDNLVALATNSYDKERNTLYIYAIVIFFVLIFTNLLSYLISKNISMSVEKIQQF